MNFKNLILSTVLLLNVPTAFCAADQTANLSSYEDHLNDLKIPIYSDLPRHKDTIDEQTTKLIEACLYPENINDKIKPTMDSFWAIAYLTDLENIKAALAAGANPSVIYYMSFPEKEQDGTCIPLLFMAIAANNLTLAKLLLEYGANPNLVFLINTYLNDEIAFDTRATPLHAIIGCQPYTKTELIYAEKYELMKLLIDKGADIYAKNNEEFTPLMLAAQQKDLPAMNVLIAAGACTKLELCEDGN